MNFRLVLGIVLAVKGAALAATCALVQGITELRPLDPYLLWLIPVGLLVALGGLGLAACGECEK